MMFKRRKVLVLPEPDKMSTTIQRLEILADHLEHTASVLETMVKKMRDEEGEEVRHD